MHGSRWLGVTPAAAGAAALLVPALSEAAICPGAVLRLAAALVTAAVAGVPAIGVAAIGPGAVARLGVVAAAAVAGPGPGLIVVIPVGPAADRPSRPAVLADR
jgi:hypothetical protein